jgi:hypothetical protein
LKRFPAEKLFHGDSISLTGNFEISAGMIAAVNHNPLVNRSADRKIGFMKTIDFYHSLSITYHPQPSTFDQ